MKPRTTLAIVSTSVLLVLGCAAPAAEQQNRARLVRTPTNEVVRQETIKEPARDPVSTHKLRAAFEHDIRGSRPVSVPAPAAAPAHPAPVPRIPAQPRSPH